MHAIHACVYACTMYRCMHARSVLECNVAQCNVMQCRVSCGVVSCNAMNVCVCVMYMIYTLCGMHVMYANMLYHVASCDVGSRTVIPCTVMYLLYVLPML